MPKSGSSAATRKAPQSDCVELKYELRVLGFDPWQAPQSDCVELKLNSITYGPRRGKGLNRTVWN